MPEYEVTLYYTGFIIRTIKAENEEEAIERARSEQNAPLSQSEFIRTFEPILETLEPWKECDTAQLKNKACLEDSNPKQEGSSLTSGS
jgi:hypothetical protein